MDGERARIDLDAVRLRIDEVLAGYLAGVRADLERLAAPPGVLVAEIQRLLGAGGKRLRPILCVLGHVAAGGRAEDAAPAGAALELFHTFALIHDDVMDDEEERRAVPATHRRFAKAAPGGEAFGRSAAILVGDLALVLSLDLLLAVPLAAERVLSASRRFRAMAVAAAAGQFLDVAAIGHPRTVARLKTGVYTAEAPVAIGADLAGASAETFEALETFARPFGVAFQLLDDRADAQAPANAADGVGGLLDEAAAALDSPSIDRAAAEALGEIIARLRPTA